MYRYILFAVMYFITLLSYNFSKKKYLSPTFISSAMFTLFSGAYIVFYSYMGRDILPVTCYAIIMSEIGIYLGEVLAEHIVFHQKGSNHNRMMNKIVAIEISKSITLIIAILILVIAILRLMILRRSYDGNLSVSLSGLISNVRSDSVSGLVSFGPILSAFYYVSLCLAYVYTFAFVQKIVCTKKIAVLYLLPVFSYCICIVSTTSRSEFIRLACAFIAAALLCNFFKNKKKINMVKASVFAFLFIVFFLWYGFAIRGITFLGRNSIWSNVVGYSCASIYGLDEYLRSSHQANELFGKYTFEYIYTLFGEKIYNTVEATYVMPKGNSNIYTALVKPIQDFGIIGMAFEKLIFSFVSVKIINICINMRFSLNKFYFTFIILTHIFYIYFMEPVGEKASYLFLNPGYLMRLIVGFLLSLIIGFRVLYSFEDGTTLSTNKMFRIKIGRNGG